MTPNGRQLGYINDAGLNDARFDVVLLSGHKAVLDAYMLFSWLGLEQDEVEHIIHCLSTGAWGSMNVSPNQGWYHIRRVADAPGQSISDGMEDPDPVLTVVGDEDEQLESLRGYLDNHYAP